jgi:hypothetical protein
MVPKHNIQCTPEEQTCAIIIWWKREKHCVCFEAQNAPENPIISSQGRLHHTVVKLTSRWRVKGRRRAAQIKVFSALPCPARPNSSPQLRLIVSWQGQKFRRRESTIDLPSSAMAEHRKHRKLRIALCHPDLGIGTSPHNQTRLNLALYSRRCLSFKTSTLFF